MPRCTVLIEDIYVFIAQTAETEMPSHATIGHITPLLTICRSGRNSMRCQRHVHTKAKDVGRLPCLRIAQGLLTERLIVDGVFILRCCMEAGSHDFRVSRHGVIAVYEASKRNSKKDRIRTNQK